MADNPRLEDLRNWVEKDPASIAFAQLAEEYRRAGQAQESVDICRAGLAIHPEYLSARVTLGRALAELGVLDEAQAELELVLKGAPENLAAIRGLAEIHHNRGELGEALARYRAALVFARHDPDLEQTVNDLARQLTLTHAQQSQDGLSLEQMQRELAAHVSPPAPAWVVRGPLASPPAGAALVVAPQPLQVVESGASGPEADRASRTVAALDQWLDAIHVARADRHS